jgi:hypothetical protein
LLKLKIFSILKNFLDYELATKNFSIFAKNIQFLMHFLPKMPKYWPNMGNMDWKAKYGNIWKILIDNFLMASYTYDAEKNYEKFSILKQQWIV